MDSHANLISVLSDKDAVIISKKLKSHPKKKILFSLLRDNAHSEQEIAAILGYEKKKSAFYTLKHRLTQDIIQIKGELSKNEFLILKEKTDGLRALLYSNEHQILEKELKSLETKCLYFEDYEGLYEVYFCGFMYYYYNPAKRNIYKNKLHQTESKILLFKRMESLFFECIFEYQDLYFAQKSFDMQYPLSLLSELEKIEKELDGVVTKFFFYSSALTIKTNVNNPATPLQMEWLKQLKQLSKHPAVQLRYPSLHTAILILMHKMYALAQMPQKEKEILDQLRNQHHEICGKKPYEKAHFYFLYALINSPHAKEILQIITPSLIRLSSDQHRFYLYYLLGVYYCKEQNFSKAESMFLKARNYRKAMPDIAHWVIIEASFHTLICRYFTQNESLIAYELRLLKKELKSLHLYDDFYKNFISKLSTYLNSSPVEISRLYSLLKEVNKEKGLFHSL